MDLKLEIETSIQEFDVANKKNKYPIYVPSKGRANLQNFTIDALKQSNLDYFIVVEPQDYDLYIQTQDKDHILVMPENDQGIAYARNFCKKHSTNAGHLYHWQIDDNIKTFGKRIANKNLPCPAAECLLPVESVVSQYTNIGLAGISHIMFAFAKANAIDFNKQIYSCFLVNNSNDIFWRSNTVDDTDYSLQTLEKGYCTVIFNRLLMNKATTMKIKGGNTDSEYAGSGRLNRSLQLQKDWPKGEFKITEQYGRVKIMPSRIWRSYKQTPEGNQKESTLESFML
jgi:hypothetical protein